MSKRLLRLLSALLAFTLLAAACGDDDEETSTTTTTTAVRDGPNRVTSASASITVGKLLIESKNSNIRLSSQRGP